MIHTKLKLTILLLLSAFSVPFSVQKTLSPRRSHVQMSLFNFGTSTTTSIPKSTKDRDNQAISSVKAALASPKVPSFPLIECEFPPLQALNKLGDGSLRSARAVEEANLSFVMKLIQSISKPNFFPFQNTKTCLLVSASASKNFVDTAKSKVSSAVVHSLKNGLPVSKDDDDVLFVMITPTIREDYLNAQKLANMGKPVIVVNGFAKDTKSIPDKATMAYYLKPLTYNSQVAGYLIRMYPNQWTTIDAFSNQVLSQAGDEDILVRGTNTPDLRSSGRLVQKSVDDRAIQARKNQ